MKNLYSRLNKIAQSVKAAEPINRNLPLPEETKQGIMRALRNFGLVDEDGFFIAEELKKSRMDGFLEILLKKYPNSVR